MNVEIGAEAALFPEKEYINGIAVAVYKWDTISTLIVKEHFYCNILFGYLFSSTNVKNQNK